MAGKKYKTLVGGKETLVRSSDASAGAANAGDIVSLNSQGQIDSSMLPDADVSNVVSFENLVAGDYVNLFLDGGVIKARKADNSNGRPAHGYVKDTVTAPAAINVFYESANSNLSGLTIGGRVYLGTTGSVIQTPLDIDDVLNDGKIHQYLGIAVSVTEVNTDIEDCVTI